MLTLIISDLHIGSSFFRHDEFNQFLDHIPDKTILVMNGDTVDNPKLKLSHSHQKILDRLITESDRLTLIWLEGNHDEGSLPKNPGKIQFKTSHTIGKSLVIFHGHDFDNVMPYHSWFIRCFKTFHKLRIKVGARPVHVAQYAKNWDMLYRYLRKNVMMNAVEYCKERGFEAVTCGHVHYPEDITIDGIRYINTGSWTEDKTFYITVNKEQIVFHENIDPRAILSKVKM